MNTARGNQGNLYQTSADTSTRTAHNTSDPIKEQNDTVVPEERQRIHNPLEKHSAVFSGIGLLKNEEVHFHIDPSVSPVAALYRPIPLAYRE